MRNRIYLTTLIFYFLWSSFAQPKQTFYMLTPQKQGQKVLVPKKTNQKTYRVAILPVCNLDRVCNPQLPKYIEVGYFNHEKGVKAFIEASSDHKVSLSGTVTPWLKPKTTLKNSQDVIQRRNELIDLASPYLNLADYDIFYIFTNVKGRGTQMGWKMGQQITTRQGMMNAGIAFMVNSQIHFEPNEKYSMSAIVPSNSWAHELIHILGITGHANSLQCNNLNNISSCQLKAYGDPFSTMGEAAFALTPNYLMRRRLGWTDEKDILLVQKNGVYEIGTKKGLPKALEIILPNQLKLKNKIIFDRVFVEKKSNLGFDSLLDRLHNTKFLARYSSQDYIDSKGAMIYFSYQNKKTDTTVLVDTYPNSPGVKKRGIKWTYNTGQLADALLSKGQSVELFESGLKIEVLNANDETLSVKISGLAN